MTVIMLVDISVILYPEKKDAIEAASPEDKLSNLNSEERTNSPNSYLPTKESCI